MYGNVWKSCPLAWFPPRKKKIYCSDKIYRGTADWGSVKSHISYTQLRWCFSQQWITAITVVNHKHFVNYFHVEGKSTIIITIQPGIQDDKVLTPILAVGWLSRSPVLLRPPAYLHFCIFCIPAGLHMSHFCMFANHAGAPLFCFFAFMLLGPMPPSGRRT